MKNIRHKQLTLLIFLLLLLTRVALEVNNNNVIVKAKGSNAKEVYSLFKGP